MRCLGITNAWLFFEHAGSVVGVDSATLSATSLLDGETAAGICAASADQAWRPPDTVLQADIARMIAEEAFAEHLPPAPSSPIVAAAPTRAYPVPDDVAVIARRGMAARRKHLADIPASALSIGAILAEDGEITLAKLRHMARFSVQAALSAGAAPVARTPAEGVVWDLWGGDPGAAWAQSLVERTTTMALIAAAYDPDEGMEESDAPEGGHDPEKVHRFAPALGSDLCMYCSKEEFDPVHDPDAVSYGQQGIDPAQSHFFSEDSSTGDCEICGKPYGDDLHKQAALAQYYQFKPAYDELYASDAKFRQREHPEAAAVVAAAAEVFGVDWEEAEDPPMNDSFRRAVSADEDIDALVWVRRGHEDEDPLTYYVGKNKALDDSMVVDAVYVFDGDTFFRLDPEARNWVPAPLPQGEDVYPVDDESARYVIQSTVFDPGSPCDMRGADPGEAHLMDSCGPCMARDRDMYERPLVSDGAGTVTPPEGGSYTEQERARNAARQGRDGSGKFAPGGGRGGAAPAAAKARLASPHRPLSADELKAVFDTFPEYVANQRAKTAAVPPPAAPAAPAEPAAPPAEDAGTPITSPDDSDIDGIKLAFLDPSDENSVMDLAQIVPASTSSSTPKLFKRVPGGKWEEDLTMLRQLQGLDPPAVAALSEEEYPDVLAQVDAFYEQDAAGAQPEQGAAAAAVTEMYGPYGDLVAGGAVVPRRSGDLVLAAVPEDGDPVWGLSSEKKPHMTVLYFGPGDGADLPGIRSALADAARSADGPVTVPVTSREKLGDDGADVLMVDPGALAGLRERLLQHPAVRSAHDAVEQYPEWRPHVTAGYPEAPAEGGDAPGSITFDRLALWDDDYAGEERELGSGAVVAAGIPGIADTPSDVASAERLKLYWTTGRGGTTKIRWNTPGDWTRCDRHLRKYMGPRAKGYCANLHKLMTGVWPGDRRNVGRRRHRGHFSSIDPYLIATSDEMIQLSAEAAAAAMAASGGVPLTAAAQAAHGARFIIPVLAPMGEKSGDGRKFTEGSLSHRDLPLPLMWQMKTKSGHDESMIVGRIDSIDKLSDGSLGNARGVFDIGAFGKEAERMVRHKFLRGVSVDLDEFEAQQKRGTSDDAEAAGRIKQDDMDITSGRVMGATLVAKPSFQGCAIELDEDLEETSMVADGTYIGSPGTEDEMDEMVRYALVAAGIPIAPPKEWLDNPGLTSKTPLTVEEDGRVFGHVATWDVEHIGLPFSTRPPKSRSKYAYFHTGLLRTADGSDIPVGQLTLVGGHADLTKTAAAAVAHYDDTASAFADVRVGEDAHGIWVAGALRPTVTGDQIRAIRASAPSGDWRPIDGRLELVAVCQVNTPGFPITRAMVSSGQVHALVAAGTATLNRIRSEQRDASGLMALSARLDRLESKEDQALQQARSAALARVAAVREQRSAAYRDQMSALRARVMSVDPIDEALFRDYSQEKREEYERKDWAMPGGRYPIANVGDLRRAIRAYGRGAPGDKPAIRRHIRKRARALGKTDMVPDSWSEASIESEDLQSEFDDVLARFVITAAGGKYPNGEPWDPEQHPRGEQGRFRQAIAQLKRAAKDAGPEGRTILTAAEKVEKASKSGDVGKAEDAIEDVLDQVDHKAKDIDDPRTVKDLRKGYTSLGKAVSHLPLAMGDVNLKYRFTDLPPELQSLVRELLKRVKARDLEPDTMSKATNNIIEFISGNEVMSQPDISAELSRLLSYLI